MVGNYIWGIVKDKGGGGVGESMERVGDDTGEREMICGELQRKRGQSERVWRGPERLRDTLKSVFTP